VRFRLYRGRWYAAGLTGINRATIKVPELAIANVLKRSQYLLEGILVSATVRALAVSGGTHWMTGCAMNVLRTLSGMRLAHGVIAEEGSALRSVCSDWSQLRAISGAWRERAIEKSAALWRGKGQMSKGRG